MYLVYSLSRRETASVVRVSSTFHLQGHAAYSTIDSLLVGWYRATVVKINTTAYSCEMKFHRKQSTAVLEAWSLVNFAITAFLVK